MDGTHPINPGDANATLATEYTRHTYRSTIASTGQRSVRRAAAEQPRGGRSGGNETLSVTLEPDGEKREIESRPDLVRALKAKPPAWVRWRVLSYSHQRERPRLNAAWHESRPMPKNPDDRAAARVAPGAREELRVPSDAGEAASDDAMTRYALLLRGVNVGASNSLPIAERR